MAQVVNMWSLLMLIAVVVGGASAVLAPTNLHNDSETSLRNHAWDEFKADFHKRYASVEQELMRRLIWEKNVVRIKAHNFMYHLGRSTYTVGMNHLGDFHSHEIVSMLNGYRPELKAHRRAKLGVSGKKEPEIFVIPDGFVAPENVDWRTKTDPAVVTPVKNQGQCGSCWAFSSTGALEAQHALKTGKLVSLSEQNLVDCSSKEGNEGCNGGLMDQAFEYIRQNGGIDTEASYPYKGADGKCKFTNATIGANDTGFVDVPTQNETALTAALAVVGPISIAIDASQFGFQFYKTGVYYDASCSSTQLDHGVLAVGYGTMKASSETSHWYKPKPAHTGDYYIVKNSWGPSWGSKGYILMSRNRKNNCGVATAASFPKV